MFKFLKGTSDTVWRIGLGSNQVQIRTNGGILELKNSGGSFYVPASASWNSNIFVVDLTIQSTKQVTLSNVPIANSEFVYLNGIKQIRDPSYQYGISGVLITFTLPVVLTIGDVIEVQYSY